jgi:hypothetical protein
MSEPGAEPTPVNIGGHGAVDMYPSATYEAARTVHNAGTTFGAVWPGLLAGIRAAEQQLGKGPLGEAFRVNYNAYEASVTPAAEQVKDLYEGLGALGANAVATYLEIDQQVVPARFRSFE